MRVSAALAPYNGSQNIEQLLESLAVRQQLPFECGVGDDRSEADTVMLVEGFALRGPFPVRISANPHRFGHADNFLAIAERSTGDVVAFCDQDATWHPEKLAMVVGASESAESTVFVAHHADVVDASGTYLRCTFPRSGVSGRFLPTALPINQFSGFTESAKEQFLDAANHHLRSDGGEPRAGIFSHDAWVWLLAGYISESLVLPDRLAAYRQHENLSGDLHVTPKDRLSRTTTAVTSRHKSQAVRWGVLANYLETLASNWNNLGWLAWARTAVERANKFSARPEGLEARANLYLSRGRLAAVGRYTDLFREGTYRPMIADGLFSRLNPMKDCISAGFRRLPIRSVSPAANPQRDVGTG